MERLNEEEQQGDQALFVGRRAELAYLAEWLTQRSGRTHAVHLWGMGGIGKSTLLQAMLRLAAGEGALVAHVDGRACGSCPGVFLESVAQAAGVGSGGFNPLEELARAAARQPVVLAVDNWDALAPLEGWLREELLERLPVGGVLVLLSSRQAPAPGSGAVWGDRLVSINLAPFTGEEAHEYLCRAGLMDKAVRAQLVELAAGHPLALSLVAVLASEGRTEELAPEISARLLHEAAQPGLHVYMDALAVLSEGDRDLLERVAGQALTDDQYDALKRLSFVRRSGPVLALHDVARSHLLADLRQRAPRRFRQLRRRAVVILCNRLAVTPMSVERRRISVALLTLCRDALPVLDMLTDLSVSPDLAAPTPFQPEDRPVLHELLADWTIHLQRMSEYTDESRLLDLLCDRFPESLRVVRAPDGEPVAFVSQLLLHRESVRAIEPFRLGRLFLDGCSEEERAALDCAPEEADTYFAIIGGADLTGRVLPLPAITGVQFHDLLALGGERTRLLGVAASPELLGLAGALGCRPCPNCTAQFPTAEYPFTIFALDMRGGEFGQWVVAFLDAVERMAPLESPTALYPGVFQEIRQALEHLADEPQLGRSALARRLALTGPDLQRLLLELLRSAEPPAPLNAEDQGLLRTAYLDGAAAAGVQGLPRLRRLRSALVNFAQALATRA